MLKEWENKSHDCSLSFQDCSYDVDQVHKVFRFEEDANLWAKEQGPNFYVVEMDIE